MAQKHKNKKLTAKKKLAKKETKKSKRNKVKYKVRNWSEYNEVLKQRGALDVWVDKQALEEWYAKPNGKRGAQEVYADFAIILTLQFGAVFGQCLRQAEGFASSLFRLMNINLDVPNFSTLSRRGASVTVTLPKDEKEKVKLVVDSTGLKVYGEGEWKVRKHGWGKHRTWMKLHLAVDPDTGELRAAELTGNDTHDSAVVPELLKQETAKIGVFAGDGAYDTRGTYNECEKRNVEKLLIPPQENAKIWRHGNQSGAPHPRDENLREIRKTTRKKWKENSGYHIRSLSETAMFRWKTIFGGLLNARDFARQKTEILIKSRILNRMTKIGMPESYAVVA
jgi:Transposase DDE domain